MKKPVSINRIAIGVLAAVTLSACGTVSMPKLDFIKTPEFHEDAANIDKSYPDVKDAPVVPSDVRSRAQWDKDARALDALRNVRRPVSLNQTFTEAEDEARFEQLKAKAHAYKKGDPVSGPVQGFPEYEPRR